MIDESVYAAETVGQRVRALRAALGLTQTEFAKRAGIQRAAVATWERGAQRPGIGPAQQIAETYAVTLDWLFLGRRDTLRFDIAEMLSDKERE